MSSTQTLGFLNVPNGTVDLYAGALRPHQRENLITKMASCDFDTGARSDIWEQFLVKTTNGDAAASKASLSVHSTRHRVRAHRRSVRKNASGSSTGHPTVAKMHAFITAVSGLAR